MGRRVAGLICLIIVVLPAFSERLEQNRKRVDLRKCQRLGFFTDTCDGERRLVARLGRTLGAEHVHAPEHRRGAHRGEEPGRAALELRQNRSGVARIGRRLA